MLPYTPGRNEYYSSATWEYLYPDGSPGIGLFTSLNHPWGSAPTFVLTDYVLGVVPTSPGFVTWSFEPILGEQLGLTWVEGSVPTPKGAISAGWSLGGNSSTILTVNAPSGTNGTCQVRGKNVIAINGRRLQTQNATAFVTGGQQVQIEFQ